MESNKPPASEPACAWCGKPESEHAEPTRFTYSLDNTPTMGRLCPVPGVTSQYFTLRKYPASEPAGETLPSDVACYTSELQRLEATIAELTREKQKLMDSLAALAEDFGLMRDQRDNFRRRVETAERERDELRGKLDDAEKRTTGILGDFVEAFFIALGEPKFLIRPEDTERLLQEAISKVKRLREQRTS